MIDVVRSLRRHGAFAQPHLAGRLALTALAAVLCVAAQMAIPLTTGSIIDRALLARDAHALLVRVALLAVAALVTTLAQGVQDTLAAHLGEGGRAALQAQVLARLHQLPIAWHDQQRTGRLLSLLTEDAALASRSFFEAMAESWSSLLQILFALAILAASYGRAVLAALLLVPLYLIVPLLVARRSHQAARAALASTADVHAALHESIQAVRDIRIFGRADWALDRVRRLLATDVAAQVRQVLLRSAAGLDYAFYFLAVSLVYWRGGLAVLSGRLSLGSLIVLVVLLGMLAPPVRRLARLATDLERVRAALARIEDLPAPDLAAPSPAARGGLVLAPGSHQIAFEGVGFAYQGAPQVLHDITFVVQPGQRIALVGPSGAGKSTLVGLLARLYEPQQGRILIDGHDLRTLDAAALRDQLGFVLQDTVLFAGTVGDNIRFGKLTASAQEIAQGARLAHAAAFIDQLPSGYDTQVGERGVQLSGGQRQRLGIARVVLRQPGILILDEAMSALDTEAERQVREALEDLMQGRTTLIVSHRPSTFMHADRILVLDQGRIVAAGRHPELEQSCPLYRRLLGTAARAASAALLAAALAMVAPPAAHAAPGAATAASQAAPPPAAPAAPAPLRGFVRDISYAMDVDGRQVPVELYKSERAGAIVLVSPSLRLPLLLRAGVLATLDPAQLERHPDGSIDLAPTPAPSRQGSFQVTQSGVRFAFEGHSAEVRFLEQPPLLGPRTVDEVTAHNPEYLPDATRYQPEPQALDALRHETRPVHVRIYYGSWCGHCRMLVPHAVKLQQLLRGSAIQIEYFGVRNPATDPEAQRAGVVAIPTAVVSVGGRERARIVSDQDWNQLEVALRDRLRGGGGQR
jgi:ABC-type multidrug transport system fused ATPase/permease subunit/thiol-disulfide isomerase/thioredoxin